MFRTCKIKLKTCRFLSTSNRVHKHIMVLCFVVHILWDAHRWDSIEADSELDGTEKCRMTLSPKTRPDNSFPGWKNKRKTKTRV